jgi:predicted metal-dependent hydrolase
MTSYDPRYLDGAACFNRGDYFAAHEAWEALWHASPQPARRFYQGLIQATVALHHATHANAPGAWRLYDRSCHVLAEYRPCYLGLNLDRFLDELRECLHRLTTTEATAALDLEPRPQIHLPPLQGGGSVPSPQPILE